MRAAFFVSKCQFNSIIQVYRSRFITGIEDANVAALDAATERRFGESRAMASDLSTMIRIGVGLPIADACVGRMHPAAQDGHGK